MNGSRQKHLPHNIPLWVDPHREIYFITVNGRERFRNQLALSPVAEKLFETIRHRQEKFLWWPHLFLLMPDHLRALLSFPPSDKPVRLYFFMVSAFLSMFAFPAKHWGSALRLTPARNPRSRKADTASRLMTSHTV